MRQLDLTVGVLQNIGFATLQNAKSTAFETSRMLALLDAMAAGFHAHQANIRLVEKFVEKPDRVRTAAHASDHLVWQFHEFLYLVIYATAHYLMAVCLYPYENLREYSEDLQRKYLLWSFLAVVALDVGENYVRGSLFDPWYYLLMILYMVILTILPLVNSRPSVMRACGWILAVSILAWSVIVRSVLAS